MIHALTDIKELRDEIAGLRGMLAKQDNAISKQNQTISDLNRTISDLRRRLVYYENPHSPPSKNSIPTVKRKKAGSAPVQGRKAPGRKKGHAGISHNRRPSSTQHHRPDRCPRCGSIEMQYGHPRSKIITDLKEMPEIVTTNHLTYPAVCCGCGHSQEPDTPGIPGTEIGENLASLITNLYAMPGSLDSIRIMLHEAFGIRLSKAAVQKCLLSVSHMLEDDMKIIEKEISDSEFLHMDETTAIIDGKLGYIWIAVGTKDGMAYSILVKVAGGRGGAVIDCHFPYYHIPITVDGYSPYESRFNILQRCWAHILRDAKDVCSNGRQNHSLYVRLKDIYHYAKILEPDPRNQKQHETMVEQTVQVACEYDSLKCKFGRTLSNAAPNLFTFLLYPGMEPTNNLAERSLRPSVIARNIRHALKTAEGMRMFSVLMTCIMTWRARGQSISQMIRNRLLGTMDACVGA